MNNLAAFMMNTLGSAAARTATDDTKVYATLSTLDNNLYYLSSLLHLNPTNPNVGLHTFTDGDVHTEDQNKYIAYRPTVDRFLTLGSKATLYDPADGTFQVQDPGIGYDLNGRLHIMADCHSGIGAPGDTHEIRYMYSDDDGLTVSSPVVIPHPITALLSFRFYGRIIDCGGVLLAPSYWATDDGDSTQSARYILRSTDDGANWTWILIDGPTTEYINETEVLHLGNGVVIAVSRWESGKQFWLYKSLDYGVTWVNIGPLGTSVVLTIAAPCRLHKFKLDDGTDVVGMYFHDKGATPKKVYGMYGRMNVGAVAGTGLFRRTTVTEIASHATNFLNYGDICHYNNNLNARGVYSVETNFPNDNELIYFECPATHYGALFSTLTPVTIYDSLASAEFIWTWRGMISNNANDFGIVNVSGQVTTLKSIQPSVLGKLFTATAGGIVLGTGVEFDGTKALSHNTGDWNFLQYSSAGVADVNWTVHAVVKFGTGSNPNAFYGLFGTNAGSAANKGICIYYDDRAAVPRSDTCGVLITAGAGVFNISFNNDNIITPNVFCVLSIEVDLSQSANNDKVKVYINGTLQVTTVTTYNAGIVTGPSFNAQIGSIGNNAGLGVFALKDLIFQNAVDIASVRDDLIDTLMTLEGI